MMNVAIKLEGIYSRVIPHKAAPIATGYMSIYCCEQCSAVFHSHIPSSAWVSLQSQYLLGVHEVKQLVARLGSITHN